jgi:hypothetical protein
LDEKQRKVIQFQNKPAEKYVNPTQVLAQPQMAIPVKNEFGTVDDQK